MCPNEQIKRQVGSVYDILSETYIEERPRSQLEEELIHRFCSRVPAEGVVVDAGCGAGEPTTRLLNDVTEVVGIDISSEQISLAVESVPGAHFSLQDMTRLGIRSDSVDGVCALYSIIHVPDHESVFEEFARILKPGSPLLVTGGITSERATASDWFGSGMDMVLNVPGRERMRSLLRETGFGNFDEFTHKDEPDNDDPLYLLATREA